MLDWLKRRRSTDAARRDAQAETPKPHGRVMSGKYVLLYKYLENRYADTVVLTFAEIEDLLGFPLPEQARLQREWWTDREPNVGQLLGFLDTRQQDGRAEPGGPDRRV